MSDPDADSDFPRSHIFLIFRHSNDPQQQRITAMPENIEIQSYAHPGHPEVFSRFLLISSEFYELQSHSPSLLSRDHFSSFFAGGRVLKSRVFYLATIFDPIFLAIPLLKKARNSSANQSNAGGNSGYFLDISQILPRNEFPTQLIQHTNANTNNASKTRPSAFELQLALICDVKQGWDSPVYRLNDSNLLRWLRQKVRQICGWIEKIPSIAPPEAAQDEAEAGKKSFSPVIIRQALAFLAEYISPDDFNSVCISYGLTADSVLGRSKKVAAENFVFESAPPVDPYAAVDADIDTSKPFGSSAAALAAQNSKRKSEGKSGGSEKKLAKIDTKGMKSLSAMFGSGKK